jgi:hypothetical protein
MTAPAPARQLATARPSPSTPSGAERSTAASVARQPLLKSESVEGALHPAEGVVLEGPELEMAGAKSGCGESALDGLWRKMREMAGHVEVHPALPREPCLPASNVRDAEDERPARLDAPRDLAERRERICEMFEDVEHDDDIQHRRVPDGREIADEHGNTRGVTRRCRDV